MKIEYLFTEEDWIQYNMFCFKNTKFHKNRLLFLRISVPVLFMVIAVLFSSIVRIERTIWFFIFGIASVHWLLFYPKLHFKSLRKTGMKMAKSGDMNNFFGPKSITLMEDGLLNESASTSVKTAYRAIQKIEFDGQLTYLFTSPILAHVIPDSAFNDTITKEMFINAIRARMKAVV